MHITKFFEQKLLFVFGRHFFNIIAVAGFSTMLSGGVVLVNSSMTEKTKEPLAWYKSNDDKAVNARDINKSYSNYFNTNEGQITRNKLLRKFLDNGGLAVDGNLKSKTFYPCLSGKMYQPNQVKLEGRPKGSYHFTREPFIKVLEKNTTITDVLNKKNTKLINKVCTDFSKNNFKSKFATNDLEKVVIGFSGRIHSIKYTFDRYDEYQNDVNSRNLLKLASRFAALIVVAAGAVVTAIASIVSGVLSIERNTRQEDIK